MLFEKIVDVADKVFDRLVPDKQKAQQIKLQFNKEFIQLMIQERELMQKFILEYEGTATQVPKFVLIMRSLIRPLFTWLFGLIGAGWAIAYGFGFTAKPIPQELAVWISLVMGFWFGGRIYEKKINKA